MVILVHPNLEGLIFSTLFKIHQNKLHNNFHYVKTANFKLSIELKYLVIL